MSIEKFASKVLSTAMTPTTSAVVPQKMLRGEMFNIAAKNYGIHSVAEMRKLFKIKNSEKFVTQTYLDFLSKFKVPLNCAPQIVFLNQLPKGYVAGYLALENRIYLPALPEVLKRSEQHAIYRILRHELQHYFQTMKLITSPEIGKQAIRENSSRYLKSFLLPTLKQEFVNFSKLSKEGISQLNLPQMAKKAIFDYKKPYTPLNKTFGKYVKAVIKMRTKLFQGLASNVKAANFDFHSQIAPKDIHSEFTEAFTQGMATKGKGCFCNKKGVEAYLERKIEQEAYRTDGLLKAACDTKSMPETYIKNISRYWEIIDRVMEKFATNCSK